MGIRQYYNKYRVFVTSVNGESIQKYFNTIDEAEAFEREYGISKGPGVVNRIRRSTARNQEYPVGVFDNSYSKVNSHGCMVEYTSIKCSLRLDGHNMSVMRNYGKCRSKEEALRLVCVLRDKFIKKHYREPSNV